MNRIIFATGNKDKMKEIREILGDTGREILSMAEAGLETDIEENGTTFEENALIKARAIAEKTDDIVLADDSGLEIDYLGKEPGIYSSRYMGKDTPYEVKNQSFIDRLEGVEGDERSARFVCAIAAVLPDKREIVVKGTMEGQIAHSMKGENGFGYDPVFYLPQYGKTSAEISPEEKHAISHRGKALRAMRDELKKI